MTISSYRSPKTEFHESAIAGKGRFAREYIKKDEIVVIRGGHIITDMQLKENREVINDAELQIADNFFLAPLTQNEFHDVMSYINHSCVPNVGMMGNTIIVAMRDISPGEEICLDYSMVFSHERSFDCRCKSTKCRKKITGNDWMIPDLQKKYGHYFSAYLLKKMGRL